VIVVGIDTGTQCGFAALRVELAPATPFALVASTSLGGRSSSGAVRFPVKARTKKVPAQLGRELYVERLASGRWPLRSTDEVEPDGCRFLRLWKRLGELRIELGFHHNEPGPPGKAIGLLAFELPGHYKSGHATLVCFGVAAHVQSWCARYDVPCEPVGITESKVAATGTGRATGYDTIEAVERLLGHHSANDDEAEAILVALVAAHRSLTR
jgi:hypothetical protein